MRGWPHTPRRGALDSARSPATADALLEGDEVKVDIGQGQGVATLATITVTAGGGFCQRQSVGLSFRMAASTIAIMSCCIRRQRWPRLDEPPQVTFLVPLTKAMS